jgi:hypothetical protein
MTHCYITFNVLSMYVYHGQVVNNGKWTIIYHGSLASNILRKMLLYDNHNNTNMIVQLSPKILRLRHLMIGTCNTCHGVLKARQIKTFQI